MRGTSLFHRSVTALAATVFIVAACNQGGGGGGGAATQGAGSPGAATGQIGGQVSVVGSWTGSEEESFRAMIAPFEQRTGVKVNYTGSRDLN